ncbi:hypothetical protein M406DRAFT_65618 [Cryphonectria parasitica EP155]|uniref:SGNH hydrolase-type esterase domain-containing protein n=1 Tax=Cryphonectria parasitica (strain ATCC 38755 / EP155) TaxID=660469 RepID=A0A9P4YA74_CRYP1|nr:uncharacterized protein M406DRAFT_65618 [Cryphonectria parasitica EP155]KAF3769328.1 hypothetical protein M406DRAFT_65618 [Cryphonectria parasitica EP155]
MWALSPGLRSLRILCFGDSLTWGYHSSPPPLDGSPSHPYSHALAAVLSRAFPALHIEAHVDGLPGDVVSLPGSRFLPRIEPKFLTKGGGTPYDWTIVLGGTNDLALQMPPEDIFAGLRSVWAVPLSKGGRVLACTVPEAGGDSTAAGAGGTKAARRKAALNDLIKGHRQENFHVFDLNAAIPYRNMCEEERERYWDDEIHLTPDGYDLMGEKIAAHLVNLIMPPGRLQSNGERAPKKRRLFRDDNKNFEEEEGDDSLLDQGYYVVRRKDLE